jgi:hypothetical protein
MDRKSTLTKPLTCVGSPAEAKVFNPNIGKLDLKIVSCHFIDYPKKSKGFRFYYLDIHTKFIEMRHAIFLEDEMMRGSMVAREIDFEKKRVCAHSDDSGAIFLTTYCCCTNNARYSGEYLLLFLLWQQEMTMRNLSFRIL